jgi:hypothetical protein
MDNLEKDIWELVTKYHLNIDYIRLKVDQMIMEYELAIQSGIAWIEYNDMMKQKKIRIFGKK